MPRSKISYQTKVLQTPSFAPSLEDVRTVRHLLASKTTPSDFHLPNELILHILDYARYHPIARSERTETLELVPEPQYSHTQLYLAAEPLPIPKEGEKLKILDVRFIVESRGPDFYGVHQLVTHNPSFFEVSIIRPVGSIIDAPIHQESWDPRSNPEFGSSQPKGIFFNRHKTHGLVERVPMPERCEGPLTQVQYEGSHSWFLLANRVAYNDWARHEVIWRAKGEWEGNGAVGSGDGFVEKLRPGDRIGLWIRASKFIWVNKIRNARVEVRYTVL
ncbi:MAG: hypothetical protein Q9157_002244 [Trypethelium eluteriae]